VTKPHCQSAADVFDSWRDDVLTGEPPTLYPIGTGELARIEIGPKLVTLIGGAPGAGKTAFTMQCVIDALRINDSLRVLVCNIEMPASVLLDRQLARLSGIDASDIRYRKLAAAHADRLDQAMNTLEHVAERLCFVRPPFDLANVAASADVFDADLIVLDYIQRIPPPGQHNDRRGSVDATMNYFIDSYIESRRDVKPGTATVYGHSRRCLVTFFGTDKLLRDITSGDADQWRLYLLAEGLSENTTRRRCGIAKQFLTAAVRKRLITKSVRHGI